MESGGWGGGLIHPVDVAAGHPGGSGLLLGAQNPALKAWQAALPLSPNTPAPNELIN